jgi:hypothetical protein
MAALSAFATSSEAREAARGALAMLEMRADAMSMPWRAASLGQPFLVHTVQREPSFWLVPVVRGPSVLGSVEIGPDGALWGQSFFYVSPDSLADCPTVVTRISAQEARALAAPLIARYPGAEASPPLYVHDGPRNRLAWMIEVTRAGELLSRIFVTPGHAWERRPGDTPPQPGVRG